MAFHPPAEPRLPLELLLLIHDLSLDPLTDYSTLGANQAALRSWSLVCRFFAPLSQARLFATPCLSHPRQLELLVRSVSERPRGEALARWVRALRIGGAGKWRDRTVSPARLSEGVGSLLEACAGLREVWVAGAKAGLEIGALAEAKALERLMLIQTPLVRTTNDPPLSPTFTLPSLRRLDGYTYQHSTDMILLHPEVLPSLKSLSIDLDSFPPGQEALLQRLEHVSTSDVAPCGVTFPLATVYDCWETAYSLGPPSNLGVTIPLPPKLRYLRIRADPDRGGERYDPRFGIRFLLEHLESGPTELKQLRVPRAWERGQGQWKKLQDWVKGNKVLLVLEDLPAIQWGRDWWADEAFWALCDRAEEDDRAAQEAEE